MNLRCTMMAKAMYLSREGGHGLPRIMICIKVGSWYWTITVVRQNLTSKSLMAPSARRNMAPRRSEYARYLWLFLACNNYSLISFAVIYCYQNSYYPAKVFSLNVIYFMFNAFSWKTKETKQFRGLLLLYCMSKFTFVPFCMEVLCVFWRLCGCASLLIRTVILMMRLLRLNLNSCIFDFSILGCSHRVQI
jgi:hypothetical protein